MLDNIVTYADRETAAVNLAGRVAADLRAVLADKSDAILAVPGGSTPQLFLRALAATHLPWERVYILPGDERWVPEDHPRSNAGLLLRAFREGPGAAAKRLSLYAEGATVEDAASNAENALATVLGKPVRADVVVLGMGRDGHTASFFPGADRLADALNPHGVHAVLPIHAPGAGEPRLTLTLPVLACACACHVLIFGDDKRATLAWAATQSALDAPIKAVAGAAATPPTIHWAP